MLDRRTLLTGIGALIAAPAIVRATSLMPVRQYTETVTMFLHYRAPVPGSDGPIEFDIMYPNGSSRPWKPWGKIILDQSGESRFQVPDVKNITIKASGPMTVYNASIWKDISPFFEHRVDGHDIRLGTGDTLTIERRDVRGS